MKEEHAMTTRIAKILLALSGAAMLAGCDSVQALPNNYNDAAIVNVADDTKVDVYENIMGVLYDSISSTKKDDVLNKFIQIVTEDIFGKWEDISKLVQENSDDDIRNFIDAHKKAYYSDKKIKSGDTEVTEDEYLASKFNISTFEVRKARLHAFYKDINERINEVFYNEIVSKSYSDDTGKFFEKRLAYAHYAELYNIDLVETEERKWNEGYLDPEFKKEDVSSLIDFSRYTDYINRKIIRTVYKDKLVEHYLVENNYSTLGRAYGRKVNIIKLTRDDEYKDFPNKLMSNYVDGFIFNKDAASSLDFEKLANAWRGFRGVNKDGSVEELHEDEKKMLTDIGLTEESFTDGGVTYKYFKETQYGQMIAKYRKMVEFLNDPSLDHKYPSDEVQSAITEFTGSLDHTKEKGLKMKLAELALNDYTTDGWYVKNGGLTDLPDAIRTRLFNINVSSDLDRIDMENPDGDHTDYGKNMKDKKGSDYVRYINGHYFLTPATSESSSQNNKNFIMVDNGSFYLVEINEAVSTSKIDIDNVNSYFAKRDIHDPLFIENIARKVAEVLGTKDSYINNAYSHYIKDYSLQYHDASIYDYFKEKYPELFEDED